MLMSAGNKGDIIIAVNYIVKNKQVFKNEERQTKQMPYDLIIPSVLRAFIEDGVVSAQKISDRFNLNIDRAKKVIADMTELGYITDEGAEREILLTEEEYRQLFEE